MSWGHALNAGVAGFQQGVNWAEYARAMAAHRREREEQDQVRRMHADAMRQLSEPAEPQPARESALTPEPPPIGEGYARSFQREDGSLDEEAVGRVVRGDGQRPPEQIEAMIRNASGNRDRPLGPRDFNALRDEMRRRMVAAGLGHRFGEWEQNYLQNIHGIAVRSLAMAASQAQQGDLEGAARSVMRAYSIVPDGRSLRIERGEDGQPRAVPIDEDGRPAGDPIPFTAQTLREFAIAAADPGVFETLLNQRRAMAEQERANRARERLLEMRALRAAQPEGAQPRAAPEAALTHDQLSRAAEVVDEGLVGYEDAALRRPRGSPAALPLARVRAAADAMVQAGMPPQRAAQVARGIGLRNLSLMEREGSVVAVGEGVVIPLPPAVASIFATGTALPPPVMSGRNRIAPLPSARTE